MSVPIVQFLDGKGDQAVRRLSTAVMEAATAGREHAA
ncbi:hypothetical protein HDA39_002227 [Kribbella italica]|uniref:Uncharacterized protein n=1 Tax=Kribbella italica TaxID=1540520 RepID=A0A7W9J4P6_9ACTN|nr:hypothetical protein [Kribbella italica]